MLSLAIGAFQTMLDRGELLDWFSSTEIIVEACLAGLGILLLPRADFPAAAGRSCRRGCSRM